MQIRGALFQENPIEWDKSYYIRTTRTMPVREESLILVLSSLLLMPSCQTLILTLPIVITIDAHIDQIKSLTKVPHPPRLHSPRKSKIHVQNRIHHSKTQGSILHKAGVGRQKWYIQYETNVEHVSIPPPNLLRICICIDIIMRLFL